MVSETAAIVTLVGGVFVSRVRLTRDFAAQRRLAYRTVAAGLVNLGILAVSGFLRGSDGFLASVHTLAGHLMAPLVAAAIGLWLGSPSLDTKLGPIRMLLRLVYLSVLSFWCLSNTWSGYLGPSRLPPERFPETALRFEIAHKWAVPIVIGTMLLIWLRRLANGRVATSLSAITAPVPSTATQPRYWCARGETWHESDGYLFDPESGWHLNRHLIHLANLADTPVFVLLGEAGTGKTTELRAARQMAEFSRARSRYVDLGEVAEASDLIRQVFDGLAALLVAAQPLYLFLDAFDEYQLSLPNLGRVLAREFRTLPAELRNSLRLRIATRGGVWSSELEAALQDLWPNQVGVYQLTPLRERDVIAVAAAEGVHDPEAFRLAVRSAGAVPLAARPLTLRLLVRVYLRDGELPRRRDDLYYRGCYELCEEQNPSRLDAGHTGALSPEQRLAIARRIAAVSMFCGRPSIWLGSESKCPPGAVAASALSSGSETVTAGDFEVTARGVREVLQDTGLFTARGDGLVGWTHRSFAEYLAASHLTVHNVPIAQLSALMFHPPGQRRIVPQLNGVAAWLAGIRPDFRRLLIERDPTPFLSADVGGLSESERSAVVQAILEAARHGRLHDGGIRRNEYARFAHPGLADQLRLVIRDRDLPFVMRRIAIDMASAAGIQEIQHELVDLALDAEDSPPIRELAARAIARVSDEPVRARLQPLLTVPHEQDARDELRGSALRALWTDRLCPLSDILAALRPANSRNFYGAFQVFLNGEFVEGLTNDDLPATLNWLEPLTPALDHYPEFAGVSDQILRRAWDCLDHEGVLEPLAQAVWTRAREMDQLLNRSEDGRSERFGSDDGRRRRLLSSVMPLAAADASNSRTLLAVGLARPQDVPWLIERLDDPATTEAVRELVALLLADLFTTEERMRCDPILEACRRHPELQAAMASWLAVFSLDSEEARRLRAAYERWRERDRERQVETVLDPPPRERMLIRLDRFDRGSLDEWYLITRDLTLEPTSIRFESEFASDVTDTPGWREADDPTRGRLVQAAKRFLYDADPSADDWFANHTRWHPRALAGYKALRLLRDVAPADYAALPNEIWERWLPALLSNPSATDDREEQNRRELISDAYRVIPSATLQWLRRLIDREAQSELPSDFARRMEGCWEHAVAEVFREVMRNYRQWRNIFPQAYEVLIAHGDAEASQWGLTLLATPLSHEDADRRVAQHVAYIQLSHATVAVWPALSELLETAPDFAADVMLGVAGGARIAAGSEWVGRLSELEVAQLYLWLVRRFPPADDPQHDGPHLVSPRDSMVHFRDGLLSELIGRGTLEAVNALDHVSGELADASTVAWARVDAEHRALEQSWVPTSPTDLLRLIRQVRQTARPLVLTAGQTDPLYIKTAIELLGHGDLLSQLEIDHVGTSGPGGSKGSGDGNLQKVRAFSRQFGRRVLVLWDCDTKKPSAEDGWVIERTIPKNLANKRVPSGIENLLPEELFEDRFYSVKHTPQPDGGMVTAKYLNKEEFSRWVCEHRRNRDDFIAFNSYVVPILREFIGKAEKSSP